MKAKKNVMIGPADATRTDELDRLNFKVCGLGSHRSDDGPSTV